METSFFIFLGFILVLLIVGFNKSCKWDANQSKSMLDRNVALNKLVIKANEEITQLKNEYNEKNKNKLKIFSTNKTDQEYSSRYRKIADNYFSDRKKILDNWDKQNPQWVQNRKMWGWIFALGMVGNFFGCGASALSNEDNEDTQTASTALSTTAPTYWNASNIPMPHLQDSLQYVSNPDFVLSQATVDSMNIYLQRLDHELNIESAVIIVNHIENDDPFRMAQDVGNRYGVGKNDRGLVVVVGYQDHSVNISTGRSLEADLTDAECGRLQREFLIPGMKAEKPDSAMLYLTKGIYATMLKKETPQMSSLYESDDEEVPASFIFYMLFPVGWGIFFSRQNRKYQWTGNAGSARLIPNPFYTYSGGGGGSYSSGGGFSSGGGGFSSGGGGSYGGGSFGGGGATSRW